MTSNPELGSGKPGEDGSMFVEFRRKMKHAEVLSSSMEKLLRQIGFTGKVSIQVQNGQVLKSGYEEGYFRQNPAG